MIVGGNILFIYLLLCVGHGEFHGYRDMYAIVIRLEDE